MTQALILTTILLLTVSPSWSQTNDAETEAARRKLRETALIPPTTTLPTVLVTGNAEGSGFAQRTPSTIDIRTRETLQDRDTRQIRDIFTTISNVDVNDITEVASVPTFTVRGTAEDINIDAFGGTPSVAYYLDDIPALSVYGRSLPAFNMGSATFYKGPHGTQFGAPGSAGALRINSVLPGNTWQGDAGYIFGSYNRHQVDGSISGPIVKDRLAIGFSGLYESRDGYIHNAVRDESYGDIEERSGRMQLVWTPSDQLEMLLTLGLANQNNGGPSFTSNNGGDLYTVLQGIAGFQKSDSNLQALRVTWKEEGWRIISATSRQQNYERTLYDFGTFFGSNPFTLETVYGTYQVREESYTQEIRAESDDAESPLQWTGGLFFGTRENNTTGQFTYSNLFGFINGATIFPNNADQNNYALFGQAAYTFWDHLELSAGLRLEMVESRRASVLDDPLLFFGGSSANAGKKTTAAASPMAGLTWKWNKDQRTYFRFSRGFQPGDIASASHLVPGANLEYGPQTSSHFELGHKASFYDGRLTVNPVLYYTDYENYQAFIDLGPPGTPITAVFNAESAYAQGAELQLAAEPFTGLRLVSNLGIQEAKYTSFNRGGRSYDGFDIPNIPAYTARNSISYRHALDTDHALMGMFEWNVTGNYEFDQDNTGNQGAYSVCNARIGYEWKHASVHFFGANLFQANYLPSGYSALPAGTFRGTPGAPQTFGVEFRTKF
jgi:iron complex outermembrane receptor protein